MIVLAAVLSIFKLDLVEDGEDPVILLMFVRNFDTVAKVESGTHITPLVDKIPLLPEESPITICDGSGAWRNFWWCVNHTTW